LVEFASFFTQLENNKNRKERKKEKSVESNNTMQCGQFAERHYFEP
jgi:hypothetical protein